MRDSLAKMVRFVKLGYNDCSTDFRISIGDWESFKACIEEAGQYNRFDPTVVIAAFKNVFQEIDSVEFGREGSPVMYVHLPYWEGHKVKNRGTHIENDRHLTDAETDIIRQEVIKAFDVALVDENYPVGLDDFSRDKKVRGWWD